MSKKIEINDPIIAEVRKARDVYAKKFNYDIDAMCRDLNKRQEKSRNKVISISPPRSKGNQEFGLD